MGRSDKHLAVWAVLLSLLLVSPVWGCGSPAGGDVGTESGEGSTIQAKDLGGLGDEYFPQAGNAGYDVLHYDISLTCDPVGGGLAGATVIQAVAVADLEEFHLDLVGLEVESVKLDGAAADYRREGQELVIECRRTLVTGGSFSVAVTYSGVPQAMESVDGYPEGWQHSGYTILTLDEPEGAATWYPSNDYPSDKATYSFRLTVPTPYVAVANGTLLTIEDHGQERTFVWDMGQPMAGYLAAVVVGDLVEEQTTSPAGIPIRDYFAAQVATEAQKAFASTGEALDYFSSLFGPYPFDSYGVVVPDASTDGAAMENQTMSLFGRDTLEESMADRYAREEFLSHELAHQWFGDSVTLAQWKDVWLNEGFATYASWLWLAHKYGDEIMSPLVQRATKYARDGTILGDPGAAQLFGHLVYERGALTLHSLRSEIGDERFFGILRAWVSEHAYGGATTEDFIALVKVRTGDLTGFDARAFFDAWLYEKDLPEWSETVSSR